MMYGQAYSDGMPKYETPGRKQLNSCGDCTRYLLIGLNMIFWMCACVVIGVTTWILVDKSFMQTIYGNVLMTVAGYLIVIGAGMAFFVTLIGCFGAIAKNQTMLIVYFCAVCLIFLMLIIGSILAIVYRTQIRNEIQYTVMQKAIKNDYGVRLGTAYNGLVTYSWDKAQRVLKCCGVEDSSWAVYRESEWYNIQTGTEEVDKPFVPLSCCVRDQYGDYIDRQKCQTWIQGPPGKNSGDLNAAVYYRGCYNAGRDFIIEFSGYLIGMGLGLGIAMISGVVLSFILLRFL